MKNETITKNMISALLGEEITKIKINETKELYREYTEEKIEIAKEKLKKRIDIDLICEITKLNKEEIEKISKE